MEKSEKSEKIRKNQKNQEKSEKISLNQFQSHSARKLCNQ